MSPESISFWADVSAIFILAQMLLFTLLFAVALGTGWWYFRKARRKLIVPLLMGQVYALRIQQGTTKVSNQIVGVPMTINATAIRVQVTVEALVRPNRTPKD